jgi:hypothetical protein
VPQPVRLHVDRRAGAAQGERAEHGDLRDSAFLAGRGGGPAGAREQRGPVPVGQGQRVGEPLHGRRPGVAHPALLDVAQRPYAHPGPLGQLTLGQPGGEPEPAQQLPEVPGLPRVRPAGSRRPA